MFTTFLKSFISNLFNLNSFHAVTPVGILFSLIFLLIPACQRDLSPVKKTQIKLTVEYTEAIEVWLNLEVLPLDSEAVFTVRRDTHTVFYGKLNKKDTLLHDENLEPAHNYSFSAYREVNGKAYGYKAQATTTTMDTTSHDFEWEIFEFGDKNYNSSMINDVAVIDENDIWVVGEICDEKTWTHDSLGNLIKPYNALHWNGKEWEYLKIPVLNYGFYGIGEIRSVHSFKSDDVWFTSTGRTLIHWDGENFINVLFIEDSSYTSMKYLWGYDSNHLYGFGSKGTLIFWDGNNYYRIPTNSISFITGMYGVEENDGYFTLAAISRDSYLQGEDKIIKINQMDIDEFNTENINIESPRGVWFKNSKKIYVVGNKLYVRQPTKKWIINQEINSSSRLVQINGQDQNDIFVLGLNGFISHYNGKDWKRFDEFWENRTFRYADYNNDIYAAGGVVMWTPKVNVVIMKRRQ